MGHINSSLYNIVITSILFCKATFLLAILATLYAIPLYLQLFGFLITTLVVHKHVYKLSKSKYLNCFHIYQVPLYELLSNSKNYKHKFITKQTLLPISNKHKNMSLKVGPIHGFTRQMKLSTTNPHHNHQFFFYMNLWLFVNWTSSNDTISICAFRCGLSLQWWVITIKSNSIHCTLPHCTLPHCLSKHSLNS
jgi:hypothetical protein